MVVVFESAWLAKDRLRDVRSQASHWLAYRRNGIGCSTGWRSLACGCSTVR